MKDKKYNGKFWGVLEDFFVFTDKDREELDEYIKKLFIIEEKNIVQCLEEAEKWCKKNSIKYKERNKR